MTLVFSSRKQSRAEEKAVKSTKMVTEAGLGQEGYRKLFFYFFQWFNFLFPNERNEIIFKKEKMLFLKALLFLKK